MDIDRSMPHFTQGKKDVTSFFPWVLLVMALWGTIAFGQAVQGPALLSNAGSLDAARKLVGEGKFVAAKQELLAYLRGESSSADAHYLLAYTLLRLDAPRDALLEYRTAAALRTPTSNELLQVADAYVLLKYLKDADLWATKAVEMNPSDANGWYKLGRIRYSQLRFSDAASCFEKAVALNPLSAKAENNLGLAYEGLYRPEEAMKAYRKAIAIQETHSDSDGEKTKEQPMLNLAILLMYRNENAEAEQLLSKAVDAAPRDSKIREQLGLLYITEGRLPMARTQLEAGVELDPGKANLHYLLGQVLHREGLKEDAETQFSEASKLLETHVLSEVHDVP